MKNKQSLVCYKKADKHMSLQPTTSINSHVLVYFLKNNTRVPKYGMSAWEEKRRDEKLKT
jgi:hypothetical protein